MNSIVTHELAYDSKSNLQTLDVVFDKSIWTAHDGNQFYINSSIKYVSCVVYIHGGAWRDPSMTKSDGHSLLKNAVYELFVRDQQAEAAERAVLGVSINYRLSPAVSHPVHLDDIKSALFFMKSTFLNNLIVDFHLIGHSCGALLCLQSLSVLPPSKFCIKTIIGLNGIYTLKELREEYPNYQEMFLQDAFGDFAHQNEAEAAVLIEKSTFKHNSRLHVIHSSQDKLLSLTYLQTSLQSFSQKTIDQKILPLGDHYDIYCNTSCFKLIVDIIRGASPNGKSSS